jgi:hypothetical protein
MPYYNLERLSDGQQFTTPAGNDPEALFYLSRQAGEQLTFDGDGPPPYLLGKQMEPLGWVNRDTAVYAIAAT